MKLDKLAEQICILAFNEAKLRGNEYVTPEHFLYSAVLFDAGKDIIENSGGNVEHITNDLNNFFNKFFERIQGVDPIESFDFINLMESSASHSQSAQKENITLGDIFVSLFGLNESYAAYILCKNGVKKSSLLKYISHGISEKGIKKEYLTKESEKNAAFLKAYTTELTSKAYNDELDPLIGREEIIERTMQVLSRRLKNNPIHVGEPGVGKTAIVEGVAQMIANGTAPSVIKNSKIYYLDISSVIAGTKYRGDFEERFIKILDIISAEENPIIYLDEIHTIVGAGAVSGSNMDASGILKPYLLSSNLKIIGSTTYSEYKKYFEKDRALVRRFQKIDVSEPAVEDCIKILNGIKSKYESFHNVRYSDEAIRLAVVFSDKYITDKKLPDKAIDVIDEAAARTRIKAADDKSVIEIDEEIIRETVSSISHIKIDNINSDELENLKNLSSNLKSEIFGQDKAVETIVSAIKASRSGLIDTARPVANLLFVGSTGVGKTEIAKVLAKNLDIPLIRFDMSEYQEKHSVARLIGAPPGYVGYEEGGLLTDAVNKTPRCVLLLDEIEKAHSDIFNILLQIMDYGHLTDTTGKESDFRNAILIMTSNAGAADMGKRIIGFEDRLLNEEAVNSAVEKTFSPEFRNRLDEIILFNDVNDEMGILIAKKAVSKLAVRLAAKDIKISLNPSAYTYIAKKGCSEKFGAREISRVVENEIRKKITDEILFGKLKNGGKISIYTKNDNLIIRCTSKK